MTGPAESAPKPLADWERIEADYRAGLMSLREIAAQHGITEGAVRKRAKRDGWERNLGPKIQARADALVRKEAVREEVRRNAAATERQIIEANAERIAQVRGEHRGDINRLRSMGLTLLAELEGQTANLENLEQLGELLRREDEKGRDALNDLYHKIISTPGRVDAVKKVAETLKTAIQLEREAYDIKPVDVDNTGAVTVIVKRYSD